MENKKVYKIGDFVEVEKIEEVSKGIVLKGLKVIECSGNNWASRIIEKKDIETFEDLKSIVILEIIENDYKITKSCYKKINNYMYNYKRDKINNLEIIINEETNASNVDLQGFVNYEREKISYYEEEKANKSFSLEMLDLTDRQKEILNIYSKTQSRQKTAELLGVAKSTVQVTIERIRNKCLVLGYIL